MITQRPRDMAPYPFQSRQRILKRSRKACDRCRSRKCKCDGIHPCYRCQEDNVACIFQVGDRKKQNENYFLKQSSWPTEGRGQLYARVNKEEESDTSGQSLTPNISKYPEPKIQASSNSSSEDKEFTNGLLRTSKEIAQHQKSDEGSSESSRSYQVVTEHEIERKNAVKEDSDEFWVPNNSMWRGIDLSIFDDMNLV